MSFAARLSLSVLSGVLLALCFPPFDLPWLVWLSLLPLMAALWVGKPLRARTGFILGYSTGSAFFLIGMFWLRHVTALGTVLAALYLAVYFGLWGLFAAAVARGRSPDSPSERAISIFLSAAAWTGIEWLRGMGPAGFGWNGLGVPLGKWPVIAQAADVIGVFGLSFMVVAVQAAGFCIARGARGSAGLRRVVRLALSLALIAGAAGYGWWRINELQKEGATISLSTALVQPNLPQEIKSDADNLESVAKTLSDLSDSRLKQGALDLLVWPESALPAVFSDNYAQTFLAHVLGRGDFTLISGMDEQEMKTYYNSVIIAHRDISRAQVQRKVHLVPFGEYLPFRPVFGYFEFITRQLPGDFDAGESTEPVRLPEHPISIIPLVCFEDTFGRIARKFVRPEPQLLVNVTNDAWFRDSGEADQHAASAAFRCIELRRPMIRAANTGRTCVIDQFGRITHRIPRLQEGVLSADVAIPTHGRVTVYARFGDWFAVISLLLALIATLHAAVRRKSPRNEPRSPAVATPPQ
ncbi:MAG: apolipoprotein N-acyltransferase [Verrucomicrobiales bacterium]